MNNSFEIKNDMKVCIDWIAFTTSSVYSPDYIIQFLGFSPDSFSLKENGLNGYSRRLELKGYHMSILFDGSEEMGTHVIISGSAISKVFETYCKSHFFDFAFTNELAESFEGNYWTELLNDILNIGHFTRLDLAIDDFSSKSYTPSSLVDILNSKLMIMKFKKWSSVISNYVTGEPDGHTVYLGTRKSDIFLRVYDKKLEQKVALPWVRWEFEIKHKYADTVAKEIISSERISTVVFGLLNNYCRVIIPDNNNRSRCTTDPHWISFLDSVKRVTLYAAPGEKDINKTERWLRKNVFPTLAGVCEVHSDFLDIFYENYDFYVSRINPVMRDLVTRATND